MIDDVADLFEGVVPAPAADRRLSQRLINAWARAARGYFPSWKAMQEMDLGDDWDWVFAVDLKQSVGFPYFIYLGDNLAKFSNVHLSGATDWTMSMLDKASEHIYAAVANEGPYYQDETLTLCDGRRVLMRAVTAPLADDGHNISHVVGAANGRFATDARPGISPAS